MSEKPRAYTPTEARDLILDHVRMMVRYWASLPDIDPALGHKMTVQDRCEGVAFSILTMLDGSSHLPPIDLVFQPHEDDKEYCIENNENWFEPGLTVSDTLHEYFYKKDK